MKLCKAPVQALVGLHTLPCIIPREHMFSQRLVRVHRGRHATAITSALIGTRVPDARGSDWHSCARLCAGTYCRSRHWCTSLRRRVNKRGWLSICSPVICGIQRLPVSVRQAHAKMQLGRHRKGKQIIRMDDDIRIISSCSYCLYTSGVTFRVKLIMNKNSNSRLFISAVGMPPTCSDNS